VKIIAIHISSMVVLLLFLTASSFAEVNYTSSAHGDNGEGVSRVDLQDNYVTGNCAHCHEQHASMDSVTHAANESLLFSATDSDVVIYSTASNFCFQCHSSAGGVENYDYSATFGSLILSGDSAVAVDSSGATQPSSILDAFNATHGHNLSDVYQYAINNPTLFPSFKAGSNSCTVCHDPHVARRNHSDPTDATLSVISLPDEHGDLFGDGDGDGLSSDGDEGSSVSERMSRWAVAPEYVAPFNEADAVDTPDYNTFCLYCHNEAVATTESYPLHFGSVSGYVLPIDWFDIAGDTGDGNQTGTYVVPGDKHGLNIATGNAAIEAPFGDPNDDSNLENDFILSCTNCHEAHGSDNDYMHRRVINGIPLGVIISGVTSALGQHCFPCHEEDSTIRPNGTMKWKDTHHGGPTASNNDNPYSVNDHSGQCDYCHGSSDQQSVDFPIACEECHYHGSYVDEFDKYSPEGIAQGVKYVTPDNSPYRRKTF
jgi:hypothetical protein